MRELTLRAGQLGRHAAAVAAASPVFAGLDRLTVIGGRITDPRVAELLRAKFGPRLVT